MIKLKSQTLDCLKSSKTKPPSQKVS